MKKGERKGLKNKSKEDKVFLLDTMVLINFAERCVSRDLFEDFNQINNHFEIVEEVEKEFKRKIKSIGQERYSRHKKNETIMVVPNDSIEIDITRMNYLIHQQFGKGELFSSLYFMTQKNLNFVSDEKRVYDVFKNKLKITITRTPDLLDILVGNKIINKTQKKEILGELVNKGFWLKNMKV